MLGAEPLTSDIFGTTLFFMLSLPIAYLANLGLGENIGMCYMICVPNTIGWIILGLGNSFVIWIIYKLLGLFKKSNKFTPKPLPY